MVDESGKEVEFAFEWQSTIIIKKLRATSDWGVLKQLFERVRSMDTNTDTIGHIDMRISKIIGHRHVGDTLFFKIY